MGFSLKKVASAVGVPGLLSGAQMAADFFGQKEAREASIASAREQMAFQRNMSGTAHQREVEDLKLAGLNPALSANSGASTPIGASIDADNLFAGVQPAISSARESRRLKADLANTAEITRNNRNQADISGVDAWIARNKKRVMEKDPDYYGLLDSNAGRGGLLGFSGVALKSTYDKMRQRIKNFHPNIRFKVGPFGNPIFHRKGE